MKALALLSGGLDSTLAVKLILSQGIEVVALNFISPFCLCNKGGKCHSSEVAKQFNIPLKIMEKGREYLRVLRNPKFGYGSGMNPCIDCRIFILKKAKRYAKEIGAAFIFTGEVLDQRPMSQHLKTLQLIEKEAGLKGRLLRPLSAKLLPETEAERKGWIDRNKLLAIRGRSRKPQMALAGDFGIKDYPCPSGGCLLTCKEFAAKAIDLFQHKKRIAANDIHLLKIGRHFRIEENKIIVGRNKEENTRLLELKKKTEYYFEVSGCGSPITILEGKKSKEPVELAARLTAAYSDAKEKSVKVSYSLGKAFKSLTIPLPDKREFEKFRITSEVALWKKKQNRK